MLDTSGPRVETVTVSLGDRSYPILVGSGALAAGVSALKPLLKRPRLFVVADSQVYDLHGATLRSALEAQGIETIAVLVPAGETAKTFAVLEDVLERLLAFNLDRRDMVAAFGGGAVGDLCGLAAGLYKRGVDFIQIPTTLLSQVDSSVGGKTAINAKVGKNMIGLFYQPRLVIAELDWLDTLPPRELHSGLAEVVKYGLIDDAAFFDWVEANADGLRARDKSLLHDAVVHNVTAKARIVAADEREEGVRALLNLGHTFAHAFELESGMSTALLHGEAVGAGLGLAFRLSQALDLCPGQDVERVLRCLPRLGLETDLHKLGGGPYDATRLVAAMAQDKKNQDGRLTFILAHGIGQSFEKRGVDTNAVLDVLNHALQH